ncbi:MAG TPA: sulfurtransferase [Steroidobacteraceae bacterium]|nr:sulfurtransferase [Steroidobacteraceae bacterium]
MSLPTYTMLIEPQELAALARADGSLAIIDCRHDLARPEWGAAAFLARHIPGAVFAHLDRDLSGPITRESGRHPLPEPERLAAAFGRWGIDRATQIVAYDQASGAYAARLWWLARFLGHARVAVLNGGLAAWQAAGLPVTSATAARPARGFVGEPRLSWVVTAGEVARGLERGEIVLVDARTADRFAGRNETIDAVAGHVPGARNHPLARNLDAQGRFLARAELEQRWRETLSGAKPSAVVSMCGSGVTACHNLLALELAGFAGARLYAGSWSEWIRDPARRVALS